MHECSAVLQVKFRKMPPHDLGSLQAAISAFIQQHHVDEGVMPSTQQLKEANQLDILHELKQHGGRQGVAASMQLQCIDPRMRFPTVALAVKALQSFAEQHQEDPQRAPTFAELRQAGRNDLAV